MKYYILKLKISIYIAQKGSEIFKFVNGFQAGDSLNITAVFSIVLRQQIELLRLSHEACRGFTLTCRILNLQNHKWAAIKELS